MSKSVNVSNKRAIAVIPTGKLQEVASEIAPYVHMTADEIFIELKKAVDNMYVRDGLETPDGWCYTKKVDG